MDDNHQLLIMMLKNIINPLMTNNQDLSEEQSSKDIKTKALY